MKPKTGQWVSDLMTGWLKEIDDKEVLNQFIRQIETRKGELYKLSEAAHVERLMKTYKDIPHGAQLYTIKPMLKANPPINNPLKFYKCKFHKWHPRIKRMWVQVTWETQHQLGKGSKKKYYRYFEARQLKEFQPSRTETNIARRANDKRL